MRNKSHSVSQNRGVSQHRRQDQEFRETLATAIGNRTYRSRIEPPKIARTFRATIQALAWIIVTLLVVRFSIELFTTSTSNLLAAGINTATNWLVGPLQVLFGSPPANGTTNGYVDWSAIVGAAIVIGLAIWGVRSVRRRYVSR